jgi:hypothetical protein
MQHKIIIHKQKQRVIVSVHITKEYGEVEVELHSLLTCALDRGQVRPSKARPLRKGYISTH